jgi:hypothetical protein
MKNPTMRDRIVKLENFQTGELVTSASNTIVIHKEAILEALCFLLAQGWPLPSIHMVVAPAMRRQKIREDYWITLG